MSLNELAAVPLFESLDESELGQLAGWFEARTVSAGSRLTGEGAAGYSFYVVAEGSAQVTSGGEDLATLGPGDFFGEVAILGDGRRTATVTTAEPSKVFVLYGTEFRRLQATQPAIADRIVDTMRSRLGSRS